MQPLSQGFQPSYALRPLEEGRGAGDHQVKAREASRVYFVDHLPEGVQALISNIASHALDGFHFIKNNKQTRVSGITQDGQHALQETHCSKVIDISLDSEQLA